MTDNQTVASRNTPVLERRRMNVGDIWSNAAKCLTCDDVIRSTNRHDFRSCSCGAVSVDGGSWYVRRVSHGPYENLIELYDDIDEETYE